MRCTHKKLLSYLIWIGTVFYVVLLVFILFIRNDLPESDMPLKDYVKTHVNLVPFSTIGELLGRLMKNTINVDVVIRNLVGNLLAFMPLGFIYPFFAKNTIGIGRFLCVSALTILLAEVLQLVFKCGILDIDDIFLNVIGAVLGFYIFSIIKHFLKKVTEFNEAQN